MITFTIKALVVRDQKNTVIAVQGISDEETVIQMNINGINFGAGGEQAKCVVFELNEAGFNAYIDNVEVNIEKL